MNKITINGKEYNAPLRAKPAIDSEYFVANLVENKVIKYNFDDIDFENKWVNNNVCFATEKDAHAVLTAFQNILRGGDK